MKKTPKHKLNFPLVFNESKKEADDSTIYFQKNYLQELREENKIDISIRTLYHMSKSLPYAVTVLKEMAEKSGKTIDEIITEK